MLNMLPKDWKYIIINKTSYGKNVERLEITLKVALFSPEEIKLWVRALEERTSCTYSINRTGNCTGERILFKQFLNCQHNTRCKKTYNSVLKNRTKNTNCPVSFKYNIKSNK
ncbi:hypothetical protein NQ314_006592 [Rhamnusium bicolor]|uniref:PH domain-containing protein n=1 Tax=Rhamnusium bicolor TaxID=1586634 RepID=A0AAV8Z002_9CUCU|nr:hypothetical protein NQ314_006592 [Rhamnusium bicolor]